MAADDQTYVLNVPGCQFDRTLILYTPQSQPSGCGSANEIWYFGLVGYSGSNQVYVIYAIIQGRYVCANVWGNVYNYDTPIIDYPCNPYSPTTNEEFVTDPYQRFVPVANQNFAWNAAGGIFVGADIVLWSKCDCTNEFWWLGEGISWPSRFAGP